jgi:hypothetical protein
VTVVGVVEELTLWISKHAVVVSWDQISEQLLQYCFAQMCAVLAKAATGERITLKGLHLQRILFMGW